MGRPRANNAGEPPKRVFEKRGDRVVEGRQERGKKSKRTGKPRPNRSKAARRAGKGDRPTRVREALARGLVNKLVTAGLVAPLKAQEKAEDENASVHAADEKDMDMEDNASREPSAEADAKDGNDDAHSE